MGRYIGGIAIFFFLVILTSYAFGEDTTTQGEREKAIFDAVKEEAIIQAIEEAGTFLETEEALEAQNQVTEEIKIAKEEKPRKREGIFSGIASLVHPYFISDLTYDDNIFLSEHNTKTDVIDISKPGIKFIWGEKTPRRQSKASGLSTPSQSSDRARIEVDVGGTITSYFDNAYLNSQQPYASIDAQFGRQHNRLVFKHSSEKTHSLSSSLKVGEQGLINYIVNNTETGWEFSQHRLGLGLGYKRTAYDYTGSYKVGSTRVNQIGNVGAFFQFSPKTRVLMEYDYGQLDYHRDPKSTNDNNYQQVWAGVEGKVYKKIIGLVKFGYETRDYRAQKNAGGLAFRVNLHYRRSSKTMFYLTMMRGGALGSYISDGDDKGSDLGLRFVYALNRKLRFDMGPNYSRDKYRSGRKDHIYAFSARLEWAFRKWLMMQLGYNYNQRDSNTNNSSYRNNMVNIGVAAEF